MSVYRKKGSPFWHYDFVWQGRRFHGSTGQKTRAAAQRVEDARRRELTGVRSRTPLTIDAACGTYWDRHAARQRSARTTEYQIENLLTGLGKDNLLSEIGQVELAAYAARRRAHVSDSSVNREIELARRVWRWCEKNLRADVGEMPDWQALLLREPQERSRTLTADEEERLIAAMEADRPDCVPLVRFALMSGCRLSEVTTLRWADVDLQAGVAVIRGKGGHVAPIPLTARMVALIADQPRVGPQIFTYVCQRGGRKRRKGERYPFTASHWRRAWARALKAAGVQEFRFHDLRHTTATRLLRATGNLAAVQKLLRHTTVTTTMRYARVELSDLAAAMDLSESRHSPEAASGGDKDRRGKSAG